MTTKKLFVALALLLAGTSLSLASGVRGSNSQDGYNTAIHGYDPGAGTQS
jgi:hypothetical protein